MTETASVLKYSPSFAKSLLLRIKNLCLSLIDIILDYIT